MNQYITIFYINSTLNQYTKNPRQCIPLPNISNKIMKNSSITFHTMHSHITQNLQTTICINSKKEKEKQERKPRRKNLILMLLAICLLLPEQGWKWMQNKSKVPLGLPMHLSHRNTTTIPPTHVVASVVIFPSYFSRLKKKHPNMDYTNCIE